MGRLLLAGATLRGLIRRIGVTYLQTPCLGAFHGHGKTGLALSSCRELRCHLFVNEDFLSGIFFLKGYNYSQENYKGLQLKCSRGSLHP